MADTTQREPTSSLLRDALDETRELVRLEVALARDEVSQELAETRAGALALGGSAGATVSAFTLLLVAIVTSVNPMWVAALILGGGLLLVATVLFVVGWRVLPKHLLLGTRERLETDFNQLRGGVV